MVNSSGIKAGLYLEKGYLTLNSYTTKSWHVLKDKLARSVGPELSALTQVRITASLPKIYQELTENWETFVVIFCLVLTKIGFE